MEDPITSEPPQPDRSRWQFVHDLQRPLCETFPLLVRQQKEANEADLRFGVRFILNFPDPEGWLESAFTELSGFLKAKAGVELGGGYPLRFEKVDDLPQESYRINVEATGATLSSSDTEGMRRGIYHLIDHLLRAGGPFLKCGRLERRAVVQTRISRCFFGPTRRPPHNWDELLDEIDYYPAEYLNKLAYEGVNGLWLTVHFDEVCRTKSLPPTDLHLDQRLATLRRVVKQCARYGIKIYLFCNEPRPLSRSSPWAKAHPELLGTMFLDGRLNHFCTSTPTAQAYLEEALYQLFSDVPGLGGLVNITVGEGLSHCASSQIELKAGCPRCQGIDHHEILHDMLAAMERGMHRAAPKAELISWPYFQFDLWGDQQTVESAGRLPPGVILQHNFESSGEVEQCGRVHKILDYWLSWPGPSQLFRDCAAQARATGNRMGAKLQVGCSHEVATAPYVPVPGTLYRKYREIHALGVSSVMQCWYFGNYPGPMTKAAGELSFAPFPESEEAFLLSLAALQWGTDAPVVVEAWEWFRKGYSQFPLNHVFGWFGPVHDSIVWPLYLEPVDRGIASSWLIGPPSGDRYGETFGYTHSEQEILTLTRRMAEDWAKGVERLLPLRSRYDDHRAMEIGVAMALGIQFESAANVLEFYVGRESLPYLSKPAQIEKLEEMRRLIEREIELGSALITLCEADARLGFHSEAEGYKYFPEKLRWRITGLNQLLQEHFPALRAQLEDLATPASLWPAYTGREPEGPLYVCSTAGPKEADVKPLAEARFYHIESGQWQPTPPVGGASASWKAYRDGEGLHFVVRCETPGPEQSTAGEIVFIKIEPRRMWPLLRYEIHADGTKRHTRYPAPDDQQWSASVTRWEKGWEKGWEAHLTISRVAESFWPERPLRVNVERHLPEAGGVLIQSWLALHPLDDRLVFANDNPADLGWLLSG